MENRVKYLTKRLAQLKEKRAPFEPLWDRCSELCALNGAIFTVMPDGRLVRNVFDSTANNSLVAFSSSMKHLIAPTNSRYHRVKSSNPKFADIDRVNRYLEYTTDLCFKFRYQSKSGFCSESGLLFDALGVYGHQVWLVGDNVGKGIFYRAIPVREAYIDANSLNTVDTVYRQFNLTAREAVEEFGKNVPEKIIREYEKTPESSKKFTFLHCVEPRVERKVQYKDYLNMPIASYAVWADEEVLIGESGYRTMPYAVPRYLPRENSPYGKSPAQQAFFDILTVNEMGKTFLRAGQLQANPGILTSMESGTGKIGQPGVVIHGALDSNGRPKIAPMQYGGNLPITLEMQNRYREIIETAFLKPLFLSLMDSTRQMTAQEVVERKAERGMLLAPMSERITAEWLYCTVERELDIIASYGLLDDAPDELNYDGSLQIEFESPAVHMQNAGKMVGMYQTIEGITSLAQFDPNVVDVIDADAAVRALAQYRDGPQKIIRTPDAVAQIREAKQKTAEAKELLAAAPVISQTIKNMGGASG